MKKSKRSNKYMQRKALSAAILSFLLTGGSTLGYAFTLDGGNDNGQGQEVISIGYQSVAGGGWVNPTVPANGSNTSYYSPEGGTIPPGTLSVAMGSNAVANGDNATAIGNYTEANNFGTVAFGNRATATGYDAAALGAASQATGVRSTAMGTYSFATGDWSTAAGYNATASGDYSQAFGVKSTASGDYSQAMGVKSIASADYAMTVGPSSKAAIVGSVALGYGSNTGTTAPTGVSTANVDGIVYGSFAGSSPYSVVSVGNSDSAYGIVETRQIQNVAAGQITASSTDAINGSELYAVAKGLTDTGLTFAGNTGSSIVALGNTVTVKGGSNGTSTYSDSNVYTTENSGVIDINLSTTPSFMSVTTGNTTMNTNGVTITNGPSMTASGINAGGDTITKLSPGVNGTDAVDVDQLNTLATKGLKFAGNNNSSTSGDTVALGKVVNVKGGHSSTSVDDSNIYTSEGLDSSGNSTIDIEFSTNPVFNSVTTGNTTMNTNGVTITNGPSMTTSGINAGGDKITNLSPGVSGTDAVDVDQLNAVVTKSHVTEVANSDKNLTVTESTDTATSNPVYTVNLANTVTVGSTAANAVTIDGTKGTVNTGTIAITGGTTDTITGLSNDGQGSNAWNGTSTPGYAANRAASEGELNDVSNNLTSTGLKFAGNNNSGTGNTVALGKVVNVQGGNAGTSVSDSNVYTKESLDSSGNSTIDVEFSTTPTFDKVSITNGPSMDSSGINAGGDKITNVAPGTIGAGSTDAVNGSQINTIVTNGLTFAGNTGSNAVALGKTVTVAGGNAGTSVSDKNVYTKETLDSSGNSAIDVAFSTTPTFDSVSITNGPSMNSSGINAGGDKITNVAPGTIGAGSTDAVNGGQINTIVTNGLTFAGNTGSNAVALGKTVTVKGGNAGTSVSDSNVYTTETLDSSGNSAIDVAFSTTPTFSSVTAGTTVLNGSNGGTEANTLTGLANDGQNSNAWNGTSTPGYEAGRAASEGELNDVSNNLTSTGLKFAGNNNTGTGDTVALGKVVNVQGGGSSTGTYSDSNVYTKESLDSKGNSTIDVAFSTTPSFTSITATDTAGNTTVVKGSGVTITNSSGTAGPSMMTSGINAGGDKITNLSPGVSGTDAVDVDQLNAVVAKAHTTEVANSDKNLTVTESTDTATSNPVYTVNLANTVTVGSTAANAVTIDGTKGTVSTGTIAITGGTTDTITGLSNDGQGSNAWNGTSTPGYAANRAASEGELNDVSNNLTSTGLKFAGNNNSGTGNTVALGKVVNVQGGNAGTSVSDSNVYTKESLDSSGNSTIDVAFSTTPTFDSVSITNGPSMDSSGINAGGDKITNVAPGTIGAGSTDAVNGGQINTIVTNGLTFAGNTGSDAVALGKTVTVKGGNAGTGVSDTNVYTTESNGTIDVAFSTTPTFSSVTGLTNDGQGSNAWNGTSTPGYAANRAASEGELNDVSNNLTSTGLKFAGNNNTGTGDTVALGKVVNVQGGGSSTGTYSDSNVYTKESVDSKGNSTIDVELSTTPSFTSVTATDTAGNTTVVKGNGVTITNSNGTAGPSMTTSGISAAGDKITNVAPGDLTATSTDAVNGSQLYTTNNNVTNLQNEYTTINNEVTAGWEADVNGTKLKDVTPTSRTLDFKAGSGITLTGSGSDITITANADATSNFNIAGNNNVNSGNSITTGKVANIVGQGSEYTPSGSTTKYTGSNVYTTETVNSSTGNNDVQVLLSETPSFTSVTTTDAAGDTTVVKGNGVTITNGNGTTGPSMTTNGISAGGDKITNVAPGTIGAGSTDAVNGGQINTIVTNGLTFAGNTGSNAVALGKTVTVKGGNAGTSVSDSNVYTTETLDSSGNSAIDVEFSTTPTFSSVTAGTTVLNGSNGGTEANTLTGLANDGVTNAWNGTKTVGYQAGRAATEGELNDVSNDLTSTGLKFAGNNNSGTGDTVALGKVVNVQGGGSSTGTYSDSNVYTKEALDNNGNSTIDVELSTTPSFTSVTTTDTAGNKTVVNGSGVTITNSNGTTGPSMTTNGISAGGDKITNVAPGTIGAGSTDAVNGGQINTIVTNGLTFAGNTGSNAVALGKTVTVKGGNAGTSVNDSNVYTTETLDSSGNSAIDVEFSTTPTFTSVTTGNTVMNTNGLTTGTVSVNGANGNAETSTSAADTITGLSNDGTGNKKWNGTSTEGYSVGRAATEGELEEVSNSLTGTGLKFAGNNNLTTADSVALGKTVNVVGGGTTGTYSDSNVTTKESLDNNGNSTIDVELSTTPSFTSVTTTDTAGNKTVVNGSGVTITNSNGTTGPSMTTNGISAGGDKITNVAPGTIGAGSTDAVNGGQINTIVTNGLTFAGNTGSDAVALGNTVTVKGGGTSTGTYSDSNVYTTENKGTIDVAFSTTPTFSSVTAGTTVLNGSNSSTEANTLTGLANDGQSSNAWNGTKTVGYEAGRAASEGELNDVSNDLTSTGLKFAGNNNSGTGDTVALGKVVNVVGSTAVTGTTYSDSNVTTKESLDSNGNSTIDVELSTTPSFTSVTTTDTSGNKTVVNGSGVTITNSNGTTGPSMTTNGISAGGDKITNVAPGTIGAGSTDAVNGGQINTIVTNGLTFAGNTGTNTVALGKTVTVQGGGSSTGTYSDSNVYTKESLDNNGNSTLDVAFSTTPTFSSVTAGTTVLNGSNGGTEANTLTGLANDGVTNAWNGTKTVGYEAGRAATEGELNEATSDITSTGLKFAGNNNPTAADTVALGGTINVVGQGSEYTPTGSTAKYTGKNLYTTESVDRNGNSTIDVLMSETPSFTSVTTENAAGDTTVVKGSGVTITNSDGTTGPSMTTNGISAGGDKITNVAPGTIGAGSTDAVNGSQINSIVTNGLTFAGNTGINAVALGKTVTIQGGGNTTGTYSDGNVYTKESLDNNGNSTLDIEFSTTPTFTSVTAGNTVLNGSNGGTEANTLTGLANDGQNSNIWNGTKTVGYEAGRAATEGELNDVSNDLTSTGLKFAGNNNPTAADTVALGGTINVVGQGSAVTPTGSTTTYTGTNLYTTESVDKSGNSTINVLMSTTPSFTSVTTGTATLHGNDGTTGPDKTSEANTLTGLANDGQYSNIWNGTKTAGYEAGRAATEGELNDVSNDLTSTGLKFAGNNNPTAADTVALGGTINVVGQGAAVTPTGSTTTYTGTNMYTTETKDSSGNSTIEVLLSETPTFTSVTTGNTVMDTTGLTTGTGVNTVKINGTNGTITAGTGSNAVTINGTNGTIKAGTKVTLDGVDGTATIGNILLDGSDATGTITGLTNKVWSSKSYVSGRAATEDELFDISAGSGGGMYFDADDHTATSGAIHKALGDTLGIVGGYTGTGATSAENVKTVTTSSGNIQVQLSENPNFTSVTTADGSGNTTVTSGTGVTTTDGSNSTSLSSTGVTAADSKGNSTSLSATGVTATDKNGDKTTVSANGITIAGGGTGAKTVTINSDNVDMGGNQIHNVAAGTAGTDAVNVNQLTSGLASAKTTVSQGKNITVTPTTESDGHIDYNVALDDTITLGSGTNAVKVDGTKGTITAGTGNNAVTINGTDGTISAGTKVSLDGVNGKATVGNVTINGSGSTGTVNGLTNKTWNPDSYTSGQAATEDQLKIVDKGSVKYDTNSDGTVNYNKVTMGGGTGGTTITNVAPGTLSSTSTDAVNGSQLYATNQKIANDETAITNLGHDVNDLGNRVDKVGAGAAALAALHPLDFDPDDKWDISAGYGHYKGANAAAVGLYYRPNEDTMFDVGASLGNGENMINAGVSLKIGSGNHVSTSRIAMAKEIIDLRNQVKNLGDMMHSMFNTIDPSKSAAFPDVPENHWAYEYVARLAGNGIIEGYPDGNFKGDRPMTRYEFAAMLYRAMAKGANISNRLLNEFQPELERIKVDTTYANTQKIDRVHVIPGRG